MRRSLPLPTRHGFTLVELMVVIAIITVLLAILMPAVRKARRLAEISVCASNQQQLSRATLTYINDHRGVLPPRSLSSDGGAEFQAPTDFYYLFSSPEDVWNLGHMNHGLLYAADLIDGGKAFFCPAMEHDALSYETHTPWPTPNPLPTSSRIRGSYYFNPQTDGTGVAGGGNLAARIYHRFSQMRPDSLLLMDMIWLDAAADLSVWNAHWAIGGWNLARTDGSVGFSQPDREAMLELRDDWKQGGKQRWDTFYEALDILR